MHVLYHNKTLALRPLHSGLCWGEPGRVGSRDLPPAPQGCTGQRSSCSQQQTQNVAGDTAHTSCSVNSHLFARAWGTAWREGHGRGEQQLRPQKHPKLWVLLLLLLSGQERVKTPFPLKASPVQVLARGPARVQGSSPGPSGLSWDPPEPRLSDALRCSILTAPKGQAAPHSADRLSRSRNSFYCQKLAPVKSPSSPAGTGSASTPCTPPYMGSNARFCPCSQGKAPHAGARSADRPGAAPGAEAEACPVSIPPWMGEDVSP